MAKRLAAPAVLVVLLSVLVAFPSTRASAQAFLDLFRVVHIAAVPVNLERLNQLSQRGLDIPTLIGSQVEVLTEPGLPLAYPSPADAARAAAIDLRLPTAVPPGFVLARTEVKGEHAARVKADAAKLQDVLDALDIADVVLPAGLDGQIATIRVPPIVRAVYANGNQEVSLFQARSPELTVPAGVDIASLAEIGLRIAGLGASEAHTLAQAVDWRSTMLVPIPAKAATFRQVDLHGTRALFVESTTQRGPKAVMWSSGGVMYAMTGTINSGPLLEMAESVE